MLLFTIFFPKQVGPKQNPITKPVKVFFRAYRGEIRRFII